jgi:DNA invertase Pin-like site-specific DNA recombinase
MRKIKTIVAYIRLSRPKKGKNKKETMDASYGIEFQRREVQRIADQHGARIIKEYIEVESARYNKRTEIHKAISHAVSSKSVLVIAKLERLARNVHFTSGLMESGVDFIACDMPDASKLTIHIMAAMAEQYSDDASTRTKNALSVAKSQGVLLGSARPGHWEGREHRRGWKKANKASAESRRKKAETTYGFILGQVRELREAGHTFKQIAEALNETGHTTTRGLPFTDVAVRRILEMFAEAA